MGRILAIDYGLKRCGIAVTDPMQLIASGLTTVDTKAIWEWFTSYFQQESIDALVVGEPKQLNNQPSENAERVLQFVKKFKSAYPKIPVKMVDERFTSKLAFQSMIDGGLSKKQRRDKALVDEISATLILQSFLQTSA
ncbi:MAG: Holliday junction resolvase RuvX [Flavobacteriaceae bacterium]|nr:Holliday junction resolvase RuvX [Flavobacteriaceae bacterium]